MPNFEVATIDADQKQTIIELDEGHFSDLKAVEIKPAKVTESVSAFANASGGELYIGIDEIKKRGKRTRKWRGFPTVEDANTVFQAVEQMAPLLGHYDATFLSCTKSNGLVLRLSVQKTPEVLIASNGIPYVRRGAQNLPQKTEEALDRLKLDKGILSFEDRPTDAGLADISNSTVILEFLINAIPSAEPEEWILKQKLLQDGRPTIAGVLLFAEEPQAILPKRSAVKIYQYKSREKEGDRETLAFDPITVEGHLYDLISESVTKTKGVVESIKKLGPDGLESVYYPDETLHEIITNAILHRDYSIATDVQIRVYDNRVEVESPGKLPGHVTAENILQEQAARNPKIVRLINKFPDPPNKDVGEGLNTAFQAMKRMKLKDPEIFEQDSTVLVRINHTPLASPEEAVMQYLESHAEITNSTARALTGITSENSMKNVFIRLNKSGLIERVPDKRGAKAAWRKT